jgi:D-beta-D-heptose 7-phosphate kinase / D-beta-D-heptose 1-phosphate adenosyltransferase
MRVFVNGTFDIVHVGHLKMLRYAKSLGTRLIVGIDSDERVKKLKGASRPINNEYERFFMLTQNKWVDGVIIFDTDEELEGLVQDCDIMVKGSDYKDKPIIGSNLCKRIVFFDILDEYSTTKKIQHISSRG